MVSFSGVWVPNQPDPRSQGLPLMSTFWPTGVITLVYVVVCYVWRKYLMSQRKRGVTPAFAKSTLLQNIIVLYNFFMVFYSSSIVLVILVMHFSGQINITYCDKYDTSWGLSAMRIVKIGYAFYISKFIELLDTLFFLLRGKVDQVTFLHVFHHAAMPPSLWWGVHYSPAGIVVIFPLINSFIHVLMYTYYGLAALGAYRYLWWKEYLTQAQMIQFMVMIVHQSQVFTSASKCKDPKAFPAAIIAYSAIFLVLFGNFYVKAYMKKQRLAKKEADCASALHNSKKQLATSTTTSDNTKKQN